MNIKRAAFALGAALALSFGLGLAAPAQAQTPTCVPVSATPSQWPPASSTLTCEDADPAAYGGLMRSTVEALGAAGTDAAQRLREVEIYASETYSITITDAALPGGSATVSRSTLSTDSLYTIVSDFADQINNLPGGNYYAYVFGNQLTLQSFSPNTPSFTASTSSGAHLTLSLDPDGFGNLEATIDGSLGSSIAWYEFYSRGDFDNADFIDPKPDPLDPDQLSAAGITLATDTVKYSAIFEWSHSFIETESIASVTAHETGHQVDHIYGKVFGISPTSNGDVAYSNSVDFKNALDRDLYVMAQIPPCAIDASDGYAVNGDDPPARTGGYYFSSGTTTPDPAGGMPGLLSGVQDRQGNFLCGEDGKTPYELLNSVEMIDDKFPELRSSQYGEIFAEVYAVINNFTDQKDNTGADRQGIDNVFTQTYSQSTFACSRLYVYTITTYGRAPTAYELSGTGYSVPDIISGAPVDNGLLGYGSRFHACDGTVSELLHFTFGS